MWAIEVEGVSKHYGDIVAVEGLDLRVQRGEVYGFLGLNGAGKTTTIRMLLGLVRPTRGAIRVLDQRIAVGEGPWGRIGHLVEMPTAYPELTVRENLEVAARLQHVEPRSTVVAAMELLGLVEYASRRAAGLSLGNLQRLGLARALLHRPELVILDEPANGLDPAGVVQVRELLASLARERGVTVFMSSHVLGEVDRVATRVGIIHQGRLLEELDVATLERRRARWLVVDAADREHAREIIGRAGYAARADAHGLRIDDARAVAAPEEVARILVTEGSPPSRIAVEQEDLEAYFLRLTGTAS